MHATTPQTVNIEPSILYFGTPVVLVSTANADGTSNLAPMSSAFWLGWRCMLGLDGSSKTTENLLRTGECVLNLPSSGQASNVDRLARLTGTDPVPEPKRMRQYTHEKRKFEVAGLTSVESETVKPPRALECPVQMEAVLAGTHDLMQDTPFSGALKVFEVRIQRVHVHPEIVMEGASDRIDPDKWNPLIMSFQKFYALAPGQVHSSRLGEIPEEAYRALAEIERSRKSQ